MSNWFNRVAPLCTREVQGSKPTEDKKAPPLAAGNNSPIARGADHPRLEQRQRAAQPMPSQPRVGPAKPQGLFKEQQAEGVLRELSVALPLPSELQGIVAQYAERPTTYTWQTPFLQPPQERNRELEKWLTRQVTSIFQSNSQKAAALQRVEKFMSNFNGVELRQADLNELGLELSGDFFQQMKALGVDIQALDFAEPPRRPSFLSAADLASVKVIRSRTDIREFGFVGCSLEEVQCGSENSRLKDNKNQVVGPGTHLHADLNELWTKQVSITVLDSAGKAAEPRMLEIECTVYKSQPHRRGMNFDRAAVDAAAVLQKNLGGPDVLPQVVFRRESGTLFESDHFGHAVADELRKLRPGDCKGFLIHAARPMALTLYCDVDRPRYTVDLQYSTDVSDENRRATLSYADQMRNVTLKAWTGRDAIAVQHRVMRLVPYASIIDPAHSVQPELGTKSKHVTSDGSFCSMAYLWIAAEFGSEAEVSQCWRRIIESQRRKPAAQRSALQLARILQRANVEFMYSAANGGGFKAESMEAFWRGIAAIPDDVLSTAHKSASLEGLASNVMRSERPDLVGAFLLAFDQFPGMDKMVRDALTDLLTAAQNEFSANALHQGCRWLAGSGLQPDVKATFFGQLAKTAIKRNLGAAFVAIVHGVKNSLDYHSGAIVSHVLNAVDRNQLEKLLSEIALSSVSEASVWARELAEGSRMREPDAKDSKAGAGRHEPAPAGEAAASPT